MGDLWIQVVPRDDRDLMALNRAFATKMMAQDVVGYETLIAADGRNPALHDDVAMLYLQLGEPAIAVSHLRASATDDSAPRHFNLGVALAMQGRIDEAIEEYRDTIRIAPDFAAAHDNLANVLSSRDHVDEALAHYREALRLQPTNARAHNNLGNLLMRSGRLDDASSELREAMRLDPKLPDAHFNLGLVCETGGKLAEAIRHLRDALELDSDSGRATAQLAWLLATAADERLRDVPEAVRLAERAAGLLGGRRLGMLDILAAAYAAAGRFDHAVDTIEEAVRLLPSASIPPAMLQRQALYRQHQPYREAAGSAPSVTP
jgi:tetratricopeptide (TPR) repeat protein